MTIYGKNDLIWGKPRFGGISGFLGAVLGNFVPFEGILGQCGVISGNFAISGRFLGSIWGKFQKFWGFLKV